ncbi:hypothetical protein KGF54_000613 [Candida jiufengensis]|uniref:uncharacterized protein n=1 Tax=Candida jiufengensis TaxID=497108 RepID=UPI00222544E8|nr:uncharacterized protein KGF54_000613 [Candida jiufengensis]KAI5956994.1 hypothetical protein KGF54_000613 [Candida jiufengensis]
MTSSTQLPVIKNAGCLIIGDEVLNGKILDTNSYNFAKFCFNNLSIPLKRTIVCGDETDDIVTSLNNLISQDNIDFIVTSGGLGSTHDDITYKVIADYFDLDYALDQEVVDRMQKLRKEYLSKLNEDQLNAFYKMATLPTEKFGSQTKVRKIFVDDELWFPIVVINEQIYILPGIPQLFTRLVNDLETYLKPRINSNNLIRRYVLTKTGESGLAPYLTKLQNDCDLKYGKGVLKIGSYPHMGQKVNTISVIANNLQNSEIDWVVKNLLENVGGNAKQISQAEEDEIVNGKN